MGRGHAVAANRAEGGGGAAGARLGAKRSRHRTGSKQRPAARDRYGIPIATYRFQVQPGFGFDRVAELLPYVASLGCSHVYLSPIFAAAPGSTHGYDVADHGKVNPDGIDGLTGRYALVGSRPLRRGRSRVIGVNFGDGPVSFEGTGTILYRTGARPRGGDASILPPHSGVFAAG